MSFRSRGFFGIQTYPKDAGEFMSVASGLGGTFTTSQKRALGFLVNGLSDLGIGAPGGSFIVYPFIGTTAQVNSLNLFSAGTEALNLTFVGSPTHSISGTSFNGTSQYAYGPSIAAYPFGIRTDNISIGWCAAGMGSGTYIPIGFLMVAGSQNKTYSTAGTFSFNPKVEAPGVTAFTISAWGGGGAGGGTESAISAYPGGGGTGGNYARRDVTLTGTQLDTPITIVVGQGGTANLGAPGGDGEDSTVTHPDFTGIAAGGGGGGNVNTASSGGAPGAISATASGSTTYNGGLGGNGGAVINRGGGGGGSSAGTGANGNNGQTSTTTSGGAAGTAPTGGANGGSGGNLNTNGSPGVNGGGAGGGAGTINTGTREGGSGGTGKVIITWTVTPFKRFSMSTFNSGVSNNQLFNADTDNDASSRFRYQTTPSLLNGLRVGSRRANAGTTTDMAFYIQNNAGTAINGPAVMSTTSLSPSPVFFFGALNNLSSRIGNNPSNYFNGYMNFAFIGPGLTNTQLQSLYTLVTTYNSILGR